MTISSTLIWILQLSLVPLLSPAAVGITRKVKALMQNRAGAPVWQPYRDLWKLLHKDEVISEDASWLFRLAPYLIFGTTLVIGAGIPLVTTALPMGPTGDFLVFVYLIALGTFLLALAGIDAGNAFGGFGSSREMMVAAFTEGGLILSLLTPALIGRTTSMAAMAQAIGTVEFSAYTPVLLAFVAFAIAMLAETCRYPFDNPATHLELTMIHEAMILEYSGKRLGLMEWAAANKYLIFISLGANLFFPWGIAGSLTPLAVLAGLGWLIIKVLAFCVGVAMLESTIAKLRIFRLPDLLLTSFVISVIALSLVR
ncbi:MAG: respiratory chain complex I subunit 1 family protein [Thermoleophilia bacterium]